MSISFHMSKEAVVAPQAIARSGRLSFLAQTRFQILGALAIAVFLPALIGSQFTFLDTTLRSANVTLIGTFVAVTVGAYVLKKLSIYPGVQGITYVVPSFLGAYGVVIAVFFFGRFDYARAQFILSFAFACLWFFFVLRIERRVLGLRYLLVPFGNTTTLLDLGHATWDVAESPDESPGAYSGLVADLRADLPPVWQEMLADAALQGVPVYHSKFLAEALTGRVEIEHLSENHLGSLLPSSLYRRVRHVGDVTLALLTLPLTLPIIGLAALAIKLADGGPVFFRQERIGFRGKTFQVLKLRTMSDGAQHDGPHYTVDADPRITPLGRLIRRWRIDELPQVFNILRGEMGWIGPRPEAVPLAEWYESQIPFYSYRHIVRPGITGWAAVNQGNVARLEAATAKLHYDFYYIKHFGMWLDVLILAKTVRTIVTGFGAK